MCECVHVWEGGCGGMAGCIALSVKVLHYVISYVRQ